MFEFCLCVFLVWLVCGGIDGGGGGGGGGRGEEVVHCMFLGLLEITDCSVRI